DGRVVRTFKDSNSKLSHNWITGICRTGHRIFFGTYGGGVFELTSSGELHSFAPETGRLIVNQNAMFCDEERLYLGCLDGAWVFNLATQKWTHLKSELPAANVLSLTGNKKFVYFGTTGGIAQIGKSYFESIN